MRLTAGGISEPARRSAHRPLQECGTAVAVSGSEVVVAVGKLSACDQCRARLLCAGMRGSLRTVTARLRAPIRPGERVRLELSPRAGLVAVVLAFVLPLVLLLASFAAALELTGEELAAGLSALGALPLYYLVLFTQRRRLSQRIGIDAYLASGNLGHDAVNEQNRSEPGGVCENDANEL